MGENEYLVHTYRAEYAKSGQAKCKTCYEKIAKGDLRLAKMTKAFRFDGLEYAWYHHNCFFIPNRYLDVPTVPGEVGLVENIDCLRWEDQEKISRRITEGIDKRTLLGDFKTEYYGMTDMFRLEEEVRRKCICDDGIKKGEVVIWKKEPKVPGEKLMGWRSCDRDDGIEIVSGPIHGRARGYHLNCFAKIREKIGFLCSGEKLAGLFSLSKEDQDKVVTQLPNVEEKVGEEEPDEPDTKRPKLEVENDPTEEEAQKERRKQQNQEMFYYRDLLGEHCKRKDLYFMLKHNNQDIPKGEEEALDRLCDMMTFGALAPCQECDGGPLVYQSGAGYRCHSETHVKTTRREEDPRLPMSEFPLWYPPVKITKKCQVLLVNPRRVKFMVPEKFKKRFDFLKVYKSNLGTRIIPIIPGLPEIQASGVALVSSVVPLKGFDLPKASKTNFFPLRRKSVIMETNAVNLVDNGEDVEGADSEGDTRNENVLETEMKDSTCDEVPRLPMSAKVTKNCQVLLVNVMKEMIGDNLVESAEEVDSAGEGDTRNEDVLGTEIKDRTCDDETNDSEKHAGAKSSDRNNNDGDKAEEDSIHKFWYKKDLKGSRKNSKYYTEEEDLIILKYIEENQMFKAVKGNKVWQDIEEKNILEGRTWQSMKERFRKVMMKRIQTYGLGEETVKKFRGLF